MGSGFATHDSGERLTQIVRLQVYMLIEVPYKDITY
jgi:hypothetical protein